MNKTATFSIRVKGFNNVEIEHLRSIAAVKVKELRDTVNNIIIRPSLSAVSILEMPSYSSALVSDSINFIASNGKEYYYETKKKLNKGIWASLAFEVYTELYDAVHISEVEECITSLTAEDYLKYLNQQHIKKLWIEVTE